MRQKINPLIIKAGEKYKKRVENKEKIGDYEMVEYLGRISTPTSKALLHRIKIRCKCGYEKIINVGRINKNEIEQGLFKCENSPFHNNRDIRFYNIEKELLHNSWRSTNRNCNKDYKSNPESKCKEKSIKIYPPWRINKDDKIRNHRNYKIYEIFIIHLLYLSNFSLSDLIDKKIKILRKNKDIGFYPYNLKLKNIKNGEEFVPNIDTIRALLRETLIIGSRNKEKELIHFDYRKPKFYDYNENFKIVEVLKGEYRKTWI